jgi:hypothetical protein
MGARRQAHYGHRSERMHNFSNIRHSTTIRTISCARRRGGIPAVSRRRLYCSRWSSARIPAPSAVPEQVLTHTATQPSCRARSRAESLVSSVTATTGIPRRSGSFARIPTDEPPVGRLAESAATITSGRGTMRGSAASATSTSKPDVVSRYANLARTSSSSMTSSTSGRTGSGRKRRSSMPSASGVRQPMMSRHTSAAARMSVGFRTDAGAPWLLS